MAKVTLNDLASLTNEQAALASINTNNTIIETAFENTLSRDGTSPNSMSADFDMNSHRILNLPLPVADTEPARWVDVRDGVTGPTGATGPAAWLPIVAWQTATAYVSGPPANAVTQGGETYVCLVAHTSGVFATDLGAGKWVKIAAKGTDGTNGAVAISGTPTVNQFAQWTDATTVKGVSITGLVKGNGASVATAATVGTDYAGPVANPTATIGLTAVNGSATGAMRSDGAPALSQSITPTWTGLHTFTANIALTSAAASIEIGQVGTANTPFFDFHSGAFSTDYDVRIIASGGTASVGQGSLTFSGAAFNFSGQAYTPVQTITDGANLTWTMSSGQKAKVTLGGNRTMLATVNPVEGASYFLWVIQDGTGSRTITWTTTGAGSFDFGTDGAPTLTTTASRADLLCFEAISIGGTLKLRYAGIKKGFS